LLDGPERKKQIENIKTNIRTVGKAGIPVIGYNFSIAGVWGWSKAPVGRGDAMSLVFDETAINLQTPIPRGMVWNMVYDTNAPSGYLPEISQIELWQRFEYFLKEVIPAAEEAGVKLALHPDDPPVDTLRKAARLVNQPEKYQQVIDIIDSKSNGLEFCMGAVQEMSQGDIYESLDSYSAQNKIAYIHFRNVRGKVPHYQEVFIDEGDIDMIKALRILVKNKFDGVLIPDHTPEVSCAAPWHAGMAFALGYMKAALQIIGHE
jgi:mannonate dehydratase